MQSVVLKAAVDTIGAAAGGAEPKVGLILGSGWGVAAEVLTVGSALDYRDIACLGSTRVEGHAGRLLFARAGSLDVLVFQGRRHWYEGVGWEPVACPVYACAALGVDVLLLTNAAGGIREDLAPGTFMVIDDHINAMGVNPLVGAHDPVWGPRFPDQSQVYDSALGEIVDAAANRCGERISHGIYLATSGPGYETPAEIEAYRAWGADAVGMSTVPEAVLGNAAGMRVAGISCITNPAAGVGAEELSHDGVVTIARGAADRMQRFLKEILVGLSGQG
jgi:purine-nucleoside phosphorylase